MNSCSCDFRFLSQQYARFIVRVWPVDVGLLHVPRSGRAALGAQPAVNTKVFVFHHHAAGLRQRCGDQQRLGEIQRRRFQARAQIGLVAVAGHGETIDRTDVDAGIALDAQLRGEHGLHVAVQATLHFLGVLLRGEAQLHLDVEFFETLLERYVRDEAALHRRVVVRIRPLVHAHLAALQVDSGREPIRYQLTLAVAMDRDRGLVAMLYRPDDVLRAERRVPAEEHPGAGRLERRGVDRRHIPLVELDTQVALDPGEGVLLADGENHVISRQKLLGHDALAGNPALRIEVIFHLVEQHPGQLSAGGDKRLRRVIDEDLDAFLLGVLELPGGGFEEPARLARHHLHVARSEPQARATAVHCGVTHADDENALADLLDVTECDRLEPCDTDVHVRGGLRATREAQLLALRRTGADKHRVESASREQLAHALDGVVELQVHSHARDLADLVVEHGVREAERGDVGPHEPAGLGRLLENGDLVAERHEVVRHRERGTAGAYQGDALTVLELGNFGQPTRDVVTVIGGDPLQAADRDRLLLYPRTPAGGLARSVAHP